MAALHFALAVDRMREATPTLDEVAHLPAGLSYLDQRTFRMYPHNPPLARMIPAAAVLLVDPPERFYEGTWRNHDPPNHWSFAFEFLDANSAAPADQARYLRAFTIGRTTIALWSALTVPFLYRWGAWRFGRAAGLLAAALWTLSPNVLAHAGLVTTDLAATSTALIGSYVFARWLERPTLGRTGLAGVLLGVCQLVKFSSLWLYPLWTLWALFDKACSADGRARGWNPLALVAAPMGRRFLGILLLSVVVLDAGYLFEGVGTPLGEFRFVSSTLTRPRRLEDGPPEVGSNRTYNDVHQARVNRFRGTWLGELPCPLPYYFVRGFDEQKFEAESKYQMYLRGVFADSIEDVRAPSGRRGWWYYYLYALAIKLPLSTGALLVGAALAAIGRRDLDLRGTAPLVALAAAPVLAMSLLTDINLGLRYVLPSLPFLFLLASSAAAQGRPAWWKSLCFTAVAYNAVVLARIHPHELSYFNELIGGPTKGRFHLIDSNIDWGEDLRRLGKWLEKNPDWAREVRLAYMGTVPPEFEGIRPHRLAPRDLSAVPEPFRLPWERPDDPASYGPQPGKFAVSVNFERGMFLHTPCPEGLRAEVRARAPQALLGGSGMIRSPRDAYAYFQYFTPRIEPQIGYSILLYDVSREEADRVRRLLGMPPLPPENKDSR